MAWFLMIPLHIQLPCLIYLPLLFFILSMVTRRTAGRDRCDGVKMSSSSSSRRFLTEDEMHPGRNYLLPSSASSIASSTAMTREELGCSSRSLTLSTTP